MARRKRAVEPLPTIWNCPDELWDNIVVPTLHELDPEPHTGRPRIDQRKALDGIIFQMRSGCQWNHLPKEFGDDASFIAPSSAGLSSVCWSASGPNWCKPATSWERS